MDEIFDSLCPGGLAHHLEERVPVAIAGRTAHCDRHVDAAFPANTTERLHDPDMVLGRPELGREEQISLRQAESLGDLNCAGRVPRRAQV